jgi:hypothetical protein
LISLSKKVAVGLALTEFRREGSSDFGDDTRQSDQHLIELAAKDGSHGGQS